MANKLAKGEKLEAKFYNWWFESDEPHPYIKETNIEYTKKVNAGKIKLPISADRCPNCKYFTRGIQTINHD